MITPAQQEDIVQFATENAEDVSYREIADQYGVSAERIRQIVAEYGAHKPRKLGRLYECQKADCSSQFRGTKKYSGHKARYCNQHRRK